ncbi:21 kDa protein [Senna tora]|uniref:21 kDa protein n=1 Tax=Senna tora TaxID=362788 RepID=A0A834TVD7_9FABA|nr:21 kDa protein [Senna tora]
MLQINYEKIWLFRVLDLTVECFSGESIGARGLVRQGGAHPGLHIADVPGEILAVGSVAELQLLQGSAESIDAVGDLLDAVLQGGGFARLEASELVELGDEVLGGECGVEAEGEGGLDELVMVLLDGGGVDGEGGDAEGGVLGGAAARFNEVGGGGGGGDGGDGEDGDAGGEEEEKKKRGWVCHLCV